MEIKRTGHQYTVVKLHGKHCAVMILSEHDNEEDALNAVFDAILNEGNETTKAEIEELRKQGINAVSVKEAMKDMTPEQQEKFLEERNRKFINPLLDMNIEMLKERARRLKIKRIK